MSKKSLMKIPWKYCLYCICYWKFNEVHSEYLRFI